MRVEVLCYGENKRGKPRKVQRTYNAKHGRKHQIQKIVGIVAKRPYTSKLFRRRIGIRTGIVDQGGFAIVIAAAAELKPSLKPSVWWKENRCRYLFL